MKKHNFRTILCLLTVLIILFVPISVGASDNKQPVVVSLSELIDNSKLYDGTTVNFEGEAIGDILYRGNYAWVNISDGNNSAIGVYMTVSDAKKITMLGSYGKEGDTLLVTGTFHRACTDHGGDLDIHAESIKKICAGEAFVPSIPQWLPCLTGISTACAAGLGIFAFIRIKCYNKKEKSIERDE